MPRRAHLGVLAFLLAAASGAQSASTITESEYLSAFDDSHPAVQESAEALAEAEAAALDARILENPVLGVFREDPSGPSRQLDLVVSWQLPERARGPSVDSRRRAVEAARARFDEARLDHRLAMRAAFATWAVAHARRERLTVHADRVALLAVREAARAESGEASVLESQRLAMAASALRSQVARAAADAAAARGEAARWVDSLAGGVAPVLPHPVAVATPFGVDPRVRAAEAELAAAESARTAAARFVPSPELSLGWQRQEAGPEAIDGPTIGFSWSVPIVDRGRAERLAAEARIVAARARLETARREMAAEREASAERHALLLAALAESQAALGSSAQTLAAAEALFTSGEGNLTDLLATLDAVTSAELGALDIREAALAAGREVERLAGSGGPEQVSTLTDTERHLTRKDTDS